MAATSRSGGRPATASKGAKKATRPPPKRVPAKTAKTSKTAPAAKKTAAKAPAKAAKKTPPKSAAKVTTKTAAKTAAKKAQPKPEAKAVAKPAPKAQGVRGLAPAGPAKPATKARGSGAGEGARAGGEGARRGPAPGQRPPEAAAPTVALTEPVDPATLHLTAAPVLHRILTCHVPLPAIARLEATGESVFSAARHALQAGIHTLEHELTHEPAAARPSTVPLDRPGTRPIAVPAGLAAALLVTRLAEECFDGDVHVAGGWLVARGAGHPVALPTPSGAATRQTLLGAIQRLAASERTGKSGKSGRPGKATKAAKAAKSPKAAVAAAAVASGARVSAPLILVPAGPQLRAMREALGVTREQVAQVAGLTPDTVGEIERDRRPTAAARLQVAEVLCGMNPATRLEA